MLVLIPCAIATLATDAPGALHSAITCAFTAVPYRRRVAGLPLPIVSTYLLTDPQKLDGERAALRRDGAHSEVNGTHAKLQFDSISAVPDFCACRIDAKPARPPAR